MGDINFLIIAVGFWFLARPLKDRYVVVSATCSDGQLCSLINSLFFKDVLYVSKSEIKSHDLIITDVSSLGLAMSHKSGSRVRLRVRVFEDFNAASMYYEKSKEFRSTGFDEYQKVLMWRVFSRLRDVSFVSGWVTDWFGCSWESVLLSDYPKQSWKKP